MPVPLSSETIACLDDLLKYWKTIELWIKRAEQVNKRAVIPSINELRYASRQFMNGVLLLQTASEDEHTTRTIRRHLILAEQYLINADHDIVDSVTMYLSDIVERIELEVGRTEILPFFPGYIKYIELLEKSDALISQAREDYTRRREIYEQIRSDFIPMLITDYKTLKESEIYARHTIRTADRRAKRFTFANALATAVTIVSGTLGIIAFFILIFTFRYSTAGYCVENPTGGLLSFLCS